ncbi:hypothetical protein [Microcoleus sp. F10-C6]|uniref:hypothetical protein n=1 Tax=Microcoleus sp. F10-C6 TaxID=2818757 RepID=UPI002FD3923B
MSLQGLLKSAVSIAPALFKLNAGAMARNPRPYYEILINLAKHSTFSAALTHYKSQPPRLMATVWEIAI